MESLVGRSLNRYQVLSLLGEGGIGAVYKARDTVLQRDVAIKVMQPEFAQRPDFRERFLQEARTAARLDNPSIVQVHDFGENEEYLYIVMEYIPGDNLRKTLQDLKAHNQWVVLNEAVLIVEEVCQALEYALSQGVLHRDIKPDNLMLKPESGADFDAGRGLTYRVVITDLGLAQLTGAPVIEGQSYGTPAYMSPEQVLGQKTDSRSDVYSLGVLLYELAVGRLPFPAKTLADAVKYTHEPTPPPRSIRPDLPVPLENIILKAMQKDPAQRYQTAGEMGKALDTVASEVLGVTSAPVDLSQTVSLLTQYDETRPVVPGIPATQPNLAGEYDVRQDYLEVLLPDHTVRNVQMLPNGLTIGRDRDNDIVLDHPKISRHHTRIEYKSGSYWVTDLNSMNGTYLGGNRLTPGVPEAWTDDKVLQVGEILMRLKRSTPIQTGRGANVYAADSAVAQTVAEAVPLRSGANAEPASVFMETVQLSVTPGNSTTATLVVVNQGVVVDRFKVAIAGIPPNWIPSPPPMLQLPPGGQQEVRITIHPPLSAQTKPGRYPLTVQVFSQAAPTRVAEVKATLTVGVFTRFTTELRPKRINADQTPQITIHNLGNSKQTFSIIPMDPMDELVFDPPQARLALGEGETAIAEFRAMPRRRRWIGNDKIQPFVAQVSTTSGETQNLNGEMINPGIVPVWVLPVLLALCLCMSFLAAYGYLNSFASPGIARNNEQTATQVAYMTQLALVMTDQGTFAVATDRAATRTSLAATTAAIPVTGATTQPVPTSTPTLTPSPTLIPPSSTPVIIVVTSTSAPTNTSLPPTPTFTSTSIPPSSTPGATPTPRGGSPLIAFSTNRDGNSEIYVMMPDGTHQTRITNTGADNTQPVWTPDHTRLAFVSTRDGTRQIYVMNADGSGQMRLSNNSYNDTSPAWSPDGTRIAFSSDRDGHKEIYAMNADGTGQTRLTNTTTDNDHPAWSPDGSHIAFDSGTGSNKQIFSMNSNSSNPVQLTNNGATNTDPVYSPDGSRIAYVSNQSGPTELYIMNSNGTSPTKITNLGTGVSRPYWSKDGKWITFTGNVNGVGQIFETNLDGTQVINVTNNQTNNSDPTW